MMPSTADVDGPPGLAPGALSWHGSVTLKVLLAFSDLTLRSWIMKSLPFPTQSKLWYINGLRHVAKELFGKENVDLAILYSWEQDQHSVSCCLVLTACQSYSQCESPSETTHVIGVGRLLGRHQIFQTQS